jgi:hypothetical protein
MIKSTMSSLLDVKLGAHILPVLLNANIVPISSSRLPSMFPLLALKRSLPTPRSLDKVTQALKYVGHLRTENQCSTLIIS